MDGNANDYAMAKAWAYQNGWTARVVPYEAIDNPLGWARRMARETFWADAMRLGIV
jgi:hypothetical protein